MKHITFLLLLSLFSIGLNAQNSKIVFEQETHDFGTIQEIDGPQSYEFVFKNDGSSPLIVNNVTASCGCTTPEWTKAPIPKGGTGTIKVSFDPKNRPGPFNKSITVASNASNNNVVLHIKGEVNERVKTVDDNYKYSIGDLKLKSNHVAMTKIASNSTKTEPIEFYNPTNKPISVSFDEIPKHITIDKIDFIVEPQKTQLVQVTYNGTLKKDFGFVSDRIMLIVNKERDPKNRITVSADIFEDFSTYTEKQLAEAPVIEFKENEFEFGTINQGDKKDFKFEFTNKGKTDLYIRKIKTSCGCTATKADSEVIKPGQTSFIDVTFNSRGKSGKQNKTITIITNDPKNSQIVLRVKGDVIVPKQN
ncbi:MAG: DUF1573 domain-containing protein [Bacteroidales bacterium]|nr:DUF1573 domain-containing protein [Bacteroidales bacterium]